NSSLVKQPCADNITGLKPHTEASEFEISTLRFQSQISKLKLIDRGNEEDRRLQRAHISLSRSQSLFEIVDLRSQVGRRAFRSCEAGPKGPLERSETTLSA